MQKDSITGDVFISDHALKNLVRAGQKDNDPLGWMLVSAIALSWGMCLRTKEWYEEACYKKQCVLRAELEMYLNVLNKDNDDSDSLARRIEESSYETCTYADIF